MALQRPFGNISIPDNACQRVNVGTWGPLTLHELVVPIRWNHRADEWLARTHAAAVVIGRRSQGHSEKRRSKMHPPRPEDRQARTSAEQTANTTGRQQILSTQTGILWPHSSAKMLLSRWWVGVFMH